MLILLIKSGLMIPRKVRELLQYLGNLTAGGAAVEKVPHLALNPSSDLSSGNFIHI